MKRIVLLEYWYVLDYLVDDSGFDFKAFKIEAIDELGGQHEINNSASVFGRMDADGDCEFTQEDYYSNYEYAIQTLGLFSKLYELQSTLFEDFGMSSFTIIKAENTKQ